MPRHISAGALLLGIASFVGCSAIRGKGQLKELTPDAAAGLASISFDSGAPVTVHGHVTTLLFSEPGSAGAMVVHGEEGNFAFATAATRDLAKQKFTRFSLKPGEEVIVSGVAASSGERINGLTPARADMVKTSDGQTLFDRAALGK